MTENQISSREQDMERYFFRASAEDFKKIPTNPIAYWASEGILDSFDQDKLIGDIAQVKIGMGAREKWNIRPRLVGGQSTSD